MNTQAATKEPEHNVSWKTPFNGHTRAVMSVLSKLLIGLLCWVAVDALQTTRREIREIRSAVMNDANRITILETLRPEDRRLLEKIEKDVDRIAERLGVRQ
jgi:hypothetical protein